tara:strand:- start:320 stop:1363 length:1044 start_codon:yes stop_codon:yes gene_type:complete
MINGGNNQSTVGANHITIAEIDQLGVTNVVCAGGATGIADVLNPITNNPNYTYTWENILNPGVVISNGAQATGLTAGTFILFAHYSDAASLNLPYAGCTTTDTIHITELPAITITSNGITHVDCYGASTGGVSASVGGGTSPYILQWNPTNQSIPNINGLNAGTYTLSVIDANQCQEVDTFEVTEPNALNVSISDNNFTLTATSVTGGVSPYTYSWREISNPNVHIQAGSSYLVTQNGTYYVVVTDANGCVQNSNTVMFNETDVIDVQDHGLMIYPNPFRDQATLDFGKHVDVAELRILDLYGKLIEEVVIKETDKYIIKSSDKAKGVYFVEVEIQNSIVNLRLIIH